MRSASLRSRSFSTERPTGSGGEKKQKKVSILDLKKKYQDNVPLTMVLQFSIFLVSNFHQVTAYDYTSAMLVDQSGVDMILGIELIQVIS